LENPDGKEVGHLLATPIFVDPKNFSALAVSEI